MKPTSMQGSSNLSACRRENIAARRGTAPCNDTRLTNTKFISIYSIPTNENVAVSLRVN